MRWWVVFTLAFGFVAGAGLAIAGELDAAIYMLLSNAVAAGIHVEIYRARGKNANHNR